MPLTLRSGSPTMPTGVGRSAMRRSRPSRSTIGSPRIFPRPLAPPTSRDGCSPPGVSVFVAEQDGRLVGSNVLDERSTIAGWGRSPSIPPSKTARRAPAHAGRAPTGGRAPGSRGAVGASRVSRAVLVVVYHARVRGPRAARRPAGPPWQCRSPAAPCAGPPRGISTAVRRYAVGPRPRPEGELLEAIRAAPRPWSSTGPCHRLCDRGRVLGHAVGESNED